MPAEVSSDQLLFAAQNGLVLGDPVELTPDLLEDHDIEVSSVTVQDDNSIEVIFSVCECLWSENLAGYFEATGADSDPDSYTADEWSEITKTVTYDMLLMAQQELKECGIPRGACTNSKLVSDDTVEITVNFLLQPDSLEECPEWVRSAAVLKPESSAVQLSKMRFALMASDCVPDDDDSGDGLNRDELVRQFARVLPWQYHWRFDALGWNESEDKTADDTLVFQYWFNRQISPDFYSGSDVIRSPIFQYVVRPIIVK